jgi:hypothetical protein
VRDVQGKSHETHTRPISQRVAYSLILSESVRMRAYSEDLRLKVLDAVDRGMPHEEVARVFGISLPSIKRCSYIQGQGPHPTAQ